MYELKTHSSIREINRESWNSCFPGMPENYDYLLTVEGANIEGFAYRYITVVENGILIAATSFFITEYNLETTLEAKWQKNFLNNVRKLFAGFLKFKLACIGSPVTEQVYFGFRNSLEPGNKAILIELMLNEFEAYTARQKINLLGMKDISENDKPVFESTKAGARYSLIPSMPGAYVNINFKNIEEYINSLSYKTRKDIRRKLKKREEIQLETRHNIDDVIDEVHERYLDTRNRSDTVFETLPKTFFQNFLKQQNSLCILYFSKQKLIAANFHLKNENTLLDKYFCAKGSEGREFNIYFISWVQNIQYCIENNLKTYQAGQANYHDKVRLGCGFINNYLYFRHRSKALNFVFKKISPLFAMESQQDSNGNQHES